MRSRWPVGERARLNLAHLDGRVAPGRGWALEVQQPEIEVFTTDEGRWTYGRR
jgi:hypothetical protein